MTGAELNTLLNIRCKTTDATFTLADKLVLVNLMKDEISGMIAASKEEAFNIEVDDDLLDDTRMYPYQEDLMNQLVRIELMLVDGDDYILATPTKLSRVDIPLQEENIVDNFNDSNPQYLVRGKHIILLTGTAIVAVTNGLKWIYKVFPSDLANLTGTDDLSVDTSAIALGFPLEFQELLARRVSIEYKDINKLPLSSREQKYEIDLADAIDRFDKPVSSEEIFGGIPDDGSDDGFNY